MQPSADHCSYSDQLTCGTAQKGLGADAGYGRNT